MNEHREVLWALAYRMLGVASEADEVVQDTFVKALEVGPEARDSLRPWLFRVATNLSRDRLRRRRTRATKAPWLPEPIPLDDAPDEALARRESVGLAYLTALEALTPPQRAVLLLRDVFDQSAAETAVLLESTEQGVRAAHARARRAMKVGPRASHGVHQEAVVRFLGALSTQDMDTARACLTADVVLTSDGAAGRYKAAGVPVHGPERVLKFLAWLQGQVRPTDRFALIQANGRTAVLIERPEAPPGFAPRAVMAYDVDPDGKIRGLYTQMADERLTRF